MIYIIYIMLIVILSQGDTIYLLYAYHPMDPTGDNDILQHQFRQSMIINLFGSIVEPPEPSDVDYLDILAGNVCIYICTYVHNCMYYVQALALHVCYYN